MKIELTKQSQLAFSHELARIADETGMSIQEVGLKAAYKFGIKCSDLTHKSQKKREIIKNPNRKKIGRRWKGAKYVIKAYNQASKDPALVPTNTKRDPRAKIGKRGLAKRSWEVLAAKAGQGAGRSGFGSISVERIAQSTTKASKQRGKDFIRIETSNKIGYLPIITPNIQEQGLAEAQKVCSTWIKNTIRRMGGT